MSVFVVHESDLITSCVEYYPVEFHAAAAAAAAAAVCATSSVLYEKEKLHRDF